MQIADGHVYRHPARRFCLISTSKNCLKPELFGIFVATQPPAIAVIDQSTSFKPLLPKALRYVLAAVRAKRREDRSIPFSTTAIPSSGLSEAIRSRKIETAAHGGTGLTPLRETLSMIRSAGAPPTLMFVTDGKFEDGTLDSLRDVAEAIWVLGPDDFG